MLSVLSCNSLQIKAHHVALSSTVRQQYFQGIDIDPMMDPSLKSIKISVYPKIKSEKN